MASIDVAVPNYNYGRHLRDCVESVLVQDVPDLRLVIIDNGSSDDSVAIAQELAARDPRVSLIGHRYNLGHQASFNEAIDWAEADTFMILCADDMLTPGSLRRALRIMDEHPDVVLAYGELSAQAPKVGATPLEAVCSWEILPADELLRSICRSGMHLVRSCSAVVRTTTQKRAGHYCPALDHSDDFELLMRLTMQEGRVARTRTPQLYMREHPAERSATTRHDRRLQILAYEAAFQWFFEHEGACHPDADELARQSRDALVGRAYWSGLSHLSRLDLRNAAGLLHFAQQRCWTTAFLPPFGYLRNRFG
jgi:glycosyltransferase involved in cell wall biosynthesis